MSLCKRTAMDPITGELVTLERSLVDEKELQGTCNFALNA